MHRRLFGIFLLAASVAASACCCKTEDAKKAPPFEPAAMVELESAELGVKLQHPSNVAAKLEGEALVLAADGFPSISITASTTTDSSVGTSSTRSGRRGTWKLYAPLREITCQCDDMGDFKETVDAICSSVTITRFAEKKPSSTVELELRGELVDRAAYEAAIEAAKPGIQDCWTQAVKADAELSGGNLTFTFTVKADGSRPSSARAGSFPKGSFDAFRDCVDPLLTPIPAAASGDESVIVISISTEIY